MSTSTTDTTTPTTCPTCGHKPRTYYPARTELYSVDDIRAVMTGAGSHWWDRDTFRFFRCRVDESQTLNRLPDGRVAFISSEQFEGSDRRRDARRYTVRLFNPADWIGRGTCLEDLGGFQAHATLGAARTAIKKAGGVPIYEHNAVYLAEVTR